jgi:hypothetical protein
MRKQLSYQVGDYKNVSFQIGTTWTQDMVWLIANDCDFEGAKKLLRERVPFLE